MALPDTWPPPAALWPIGNMITNQGNLCLESIQKRQRERKSPLQCLSVHGDGTRHRPRKQPAKVVSPVRVFTGYPSLVTSRKWKVHKVLILDVTRQHQRALHTPCQGRTALTFNSSCLGAALAAKTQLPAFSALLRPTIGLLQ